jgi:hypothetical protein
VFPTTTCFSSVVLNFGLPTHPAGCATHAAEVVSPVIFLETSFKQNDH